MNLTKRIASCLFYWTLLVDSYMIESVPLPQTACLHWHPRSRFPALGQSYHHLSKLIGFPLASAVSFGGFAHLTGCVLGEIKIHKEKAI